MANKAVMEMLVARVIEREGGFVDHPADRGGATNFGITIGTLSDWRRAPVSRDDVAQLTREEAALIYERMYFTASGFDAIEDGPLLEFMFDWAVHAGNRVPTRALQVAIGSTPDGAMGPATKAALAAVSNIEALYWRLKYHRAISLMRQIGGDHSQAVFATGWSNRLDKLTRS